MQDYTIAKDAHGNYYLCHGVEWKNHKYIKKIGKGIGALYFYTPDELKRYLQNVAKTAQQTGQNIKTAGQEVAKKMQLNSETANAVKTKVREASQRAQSSSRRIAKEAQTGVQAAAKTVKQTAGRAASEIKRAAKEAQGRIKNSTRTKNSETRTAPHAPLTLSSNPKKNQAQLDKVKKDDLALLADKSQDAAESKKDAEGTGVKEGSSAHGLTSHRKNVTGSAKEGWSKTREVVPEQNKVDLNDVATALGDKTAMGNDYAQEYIKSAMQTYAADLDEIRTNAKDLEFQIARDKEALEETNKKIQEYQDNNGSRIAPKTSRSEIAKLNDDRKSLEKEIASSEASLARTKKYYENGVEELNAILGYYQKTYM